jgi:hypothetical protein
VCNPPPTHRVAQELYLRSVNEDVIKNISRVRIKSHTGTVSVPIGSAAAATPVPSERAFRINGPPMPSAARPGLQPQTRADGVVFVPSASPQPAPPTAGKLRLKFAVAPPAPVAGK